MNPEAKAPADAVRDYVGFRQGINLDTKKAATMARELAAYVAATEDLRATLAPGDQPADFRRALANEGTSRDEGHT
jgi:hypothetical protein